MHFRRVFAVILFGMFLLVEFSLAQEVTITYWQYEFKAKVEAIDTLIKQFEAQNPGIKVIQETFPYNTYNQKVATAVPAGQGPDVVNLYYGWIPQYVRSGYLQALPEAVFSAQEIETAFAPMIRASKFEDRYWGLPTAVRTLALFYNKELFQKNEIAGPPKTWEEFVASGKRLTKGSGMQMTQAGFAPGNQKYHLWREVLVRQFGGEPYSNDGKKVTYDSEAGLEAFMFYAGLITKEQIGLLDFFPGYGGFREAFIAGRVGMIIDGSFAIGAMQKGAMMDWGVTELPTRSNGDKVNYGSFWIHGITKNATGPKLEAAQKFLQFLTSADVMRYWLEVVGEIPARRKRADDPALLKDPIYGPFIAAVPYAHTTAFVDENAQRKIFVDGLNAVVINNADPAATLEAMARAEQKLLDAFWKKE